MNDLSEFLLARIAETKAAAEADRGEWAEFVAEDCAAKRQIVETRSRLVKAMAIKDPLGMGDDSQLYTLDWVLDRLALPYADHPDYQAEWRP